MWSSLIPFFDFDLRKPLQAHAVTYLCPHCMELETSGLMIRDVYLGCQVYGRGRDVSCMGYILLFKAAFELGSGMGLEAEAQGPGFGTIVENETGSS